MPGEVRAARPADRRTIARTLATAFADDPVFEHLVPKRLPGRDRRLHRCFLIDAWRSVGLGGAAMTADASGAAVWFPPGTAIAPWWQQLALAPVWAGAVFRSNTAVAARVEQLLAHGHPHEPHWYLLYLGATRTGAGIGSALLRDRLARCDAEGVPAYLEATGDANRALYRRHGFVDRDPIQLPDGGPPMYPMWRDPA